MKFERALVTGASSGIGRGIARELAARGALVVLAARRLPELEALAREIRAARGRAEVLELDVRDTQAVAAAVDLWDARVGGFDLVLANAGIAAPDAHDKLGVRSVEEVLRVNLLGACATLCAALPHFVARGHGTLAATTSLASLRGFPASGAYSASKAGLSTFLESLAADLEGSGVRVVDIQPGFVRTAMTAQNPFAMPGLMDLEPAVQKSVNGLERGKVIVHYPASLSWTLRAGLRPLPRVLWLRIARHLRRRARGDGAPGASGA